MKKFFTLLILITIVGGGLYVSFSDVEIMQEDTTIEIPNSRFFDAQ